MKNDEEFLTAIRASPTDETLRLHYAAWLEEQSDPRAAYLRTEIEHFRNESNDVPGSPLWELQKKVDMVWTKMVSRAPFGILVPGLTFSDSGPKVQVADLRRIEEHWQAQLPPEYAAFLLSFNGGRPSLPYLVTNDDYEEDYDEVQFFSTVDRDPHDRPYFLQSVVDVYHGRVSDPADTDRLSRMMPLGTVSRNDGSEALLVLDFEGDEYAQITQVVYWPDRGVSQDCDVHTTDSFTSVLMELEER